MSLTLALFTVWNISFSLAPTNAVAIAAAAAFAVFSRLIFAFQHTFPFILLVIAELYELERWHTYDRYSTRATSQLNLTFRKMVPLWKPSIFYCFTLPKISMLFSPKQHMNVCVWNEREKKNQQHQQIFAWRILHRRDGKRKIAMRVKCSHKRKVFYSRTKIC